MDYDTFKILAALHTALHDENADTQAKAAYDKFTQKPEDEQVALANMLRKAVRQPLRDLNDNFMKVPLH